MCGICGVIDFQGKSAGKYIEAMNKAQRHRGPDDEGFLLGERLSGKYVSAIGDDTVPEIHLNHIESFQDQPYDLAFGLRRLAILDLTVAGHGPMVSHKGKLCITYNGEIYNYIELRNELILKGHVFQTETDTEVILAAYQEWGIECLSRFNGMWAFGIWDIARKKIFFARDRFGVKPFNYFWDGNLFAFASEIKALLTHPAIKAIPNDVAVYDFLIHGSLNQGDATFFEGIKTLPASHYLMLDLETHQLTCQRWWDVPINRSLEDGLEKEGEYLEEFIDLLTDAVRLRLRSDVPVGSCLSGGIDSSTLVSVTNQLFDKEHVLPSELIGKQQKTFSARFKLQQIDEGAFIESVVQKTGVDAHYVFPKGREGLWREIREVHKHQEQPVSSTSIYAQWCVMRLAKQKGVTVLLDGQGADELLGGYANYLGPYLAQILLQAGPLQMWRNVRKSSYASRVSIPFLLGMSLFHLLPEAVRTVSLRLANTRFRTNPTLSERMLSRSLLQQYTGRNLSNGKYRSFVNLSDQLYDSLYKSSLPALLHYEDRNSMAFSVEARLPYLDYRLVNFAFSLPANYRIREGWSKWILRKGTSGLVPDEIRWRRGKLGFATPENDWLLGNVDLITHTLAGELFSNKYFNDTTIDQLRNHHALNKRNFPGLWRIISLEYWMRSFFG